MRLCFATNNQHKVSEVRHALGGSIELLTLSEINCFEELPETMPTLEGNSLQKAAYVFDHYGIPCFADDTGLEVASLGGAPGVYSARYAGDQRSSEDNIVLLLKNLEGKNNRKAQFRTIFTLVGIEKQPVVFEGKVEGDITTVKRGTSGFGYDPVFVPSGHQLTFAEMDLASKNTISHRALATKKLIDYLVGQAR
jgi:XTP/dITP diphosphohydrolase